MKDLLVLLVVLVGYYALQRYLLPRMGVPT